MNFRRRMIAAVFVVCVLSASGCRKDAQPQSESSEGAGASAHPVMSPQSLLGAAAVGFTDAAGVAFTVVEEPRIVSVVPSVTEILFALGVGDHVIGVTTNCDYPDEAMTKEKIGDYALNYEKIIALEPNLVVGSRGFTDGAADVLREANIPYFTCSHADLAEIIESINTLGGVLRVKDRAAEIAMSFEGAIERAKGRAVGHDRPTVFWAQWNNPLSTVGPGNFHHDLIEKAGGTNIAADLGSPYGPFSEESLAARNPDVILVASNSMAEWIAQRFPTTSAVQNERVYVFSSNESARPGPRLATALDDLSRLLFPTVP